MNKLHRFDVALKFITSIDSKSDVLDVESNRNCALFRIAVSLAMRTSLIIFNNSIIGMPSDELEKILTWLKHRIEVEGNNQQVIVIQRDMNLMPIRGFHVVKCTQNAHGNI